MSNNIFNRVLLVYFSGTGGSKRIADGFEEQLIKRDCQVEKASLDYSGLAKRKEKEKYDLKTSDLIILIFPVHAFDAPQPIYEWIKSCDGGNKKIAVISVSGGGEAWPNSGSRNGCCKALEEKGFEVIYEKMMVMPSNWVIKINDDLAMWLIKVIPEKVNKVLDSIFSGKIRRTKFKKGFFRRYVTKAEKEGTKNFPKEIIIDDNCTGCGWCARNCPVNNIDLKNQRPDFKDKCTACFRCIYGCPFHAMKSKNLMVLKAGFNLEEVEKRMTGVELQPIKKCSKGILLKGVRDYLLDKDGF